TGAGIIGAHLAARRVGTAVVRDRGAGDHEPVHHHGRRCHGVRARLKGRNPQAGLQIHHSAATESGAGPAVPRVQREQLRLRRGDEDAPEWWIDRKSTRLNSSHLVISYAVFCLKKKKKKTTNTETAKADTGHKEGGAPGAHPFAPKPAPPLPPGMPAPDQSAPRADIQPRLTEPG